MTQLLKDFWYDITPKHIESLFDIKNGVAVLSPRGDIRSLLLEISKEKNVDMISSETIGDIYQDFTQKVVFANQDLFTSIKHTF